jgi:hypothetical protein
VSGTRDPRLGDCDLARGAFDFRVTRYNVGIQILTWPKEVIDGRIHDLERFQCEKLFKLAQSDKAEVAELDTQFDILSESPIAGSQLEASKDFTMTITYRIDGTYNNPKACLSTVV